MVLTYINGRLVTSGNVFFVQFVCLIILLYALLCIQNPSTLKLTKAGF